MGNFFSRKCDVPGCHHNKRRSYCNYHRGHPPCQFHECGRNTVDGSLYCDAHTCRFANCFGRVKEQLGCDDNGYKAYLYCFEHNCQSEKCTNFTEPNTKCCYRCRLECCKESESVPAPALATEAVSSECCHAGTSCCKPGVSCCSSQDTPTNLPLPGNVSEPNQEANGSHINLVVSEVDVMGPVSGNGCVDCKQCQRCKSCLKCQNCTDLDTCQECANTHRSINSTKCQNSSNLENCHSCVNTHRSVNCLNCQNCQDCVNCQDCQDCPPAGL